MPSKKPTVHQKRGPFARPQGQSSKPAQFPNSDSAANESEEVPPLGANCRDTIVIFDDQSRITVWSSGARLVFGYSAQEAIGKDLRSLLAPPGCQDDSWGGLAHSRGRARNSCAGRITKWKARRKNGEELPVEISLSRIRSGRQRQTIAVIRDITDYERTETARRRNEVRLQLALDVEGTAIWDYNFQERRIYSDHTLWSWVGRNPETGSISSEEWRAVSYPDDIPRLLEALELHVTGQAPRFEIEYRVKHASGNYHWVRSTGRIVEKDALGNPVRMIGMGFDITNRKKMEESLQESQERFAKAFHSSPALMVIAEIETGRTIDINQRCLSVLGLAREDAVGHTSLELGLWKDPDLRARTIAELQNRGFVREVPAQFIAKSGEIRSTLWSAEIINIDKRPLELSLFYDCTEHQKAQEELALQKQHLELASRAARVALWAWDSATGKVEWSGAVDDMLGYAPGEFPRTLEGWVESVHPEDRDIFVEVLQQHLAHGTLYTDEYRVRKKDGAYVWWLGDGSCLRNTSGGVTEMYGACVDITERKQSESERRQLQAQLNQAQKMEAIGLLSGGVAHDFNNILTAVLMHLGMMRSTAGSQPEMTEQLSELEAEVQRAAALTRQLLAFSRRSLMRITVFDLNSLLGNLVKMMRRLIGENITLILGGLTNDIWIEADPGMIEQVVVNLAVNARDAMPEGGRLTLNARHVVIDDAACETNPEARAGRFVRLSVTDNGCGMAPCTLKRIFEPFFTTKEPGKGTGLGLATVHGIVKQHHGWVEVESLIGKGSTFSVYLPAYDKAVPVADEASETADIPGGSETILFVEDEKSVRVSASQLLRNLGYEVIEARNAREAFCAWKKHDLKIDLLITDIVMPGGTGGLELSRRLVKLKPSLKTILVSGYSGEIVNGGMPESDRVRFEQKPFSSEQLVKAVRNFLDKSHNQEENGSKE